MEYVVWFDFQITLVFMKQFFLKTSLKHLLKRCRLAIWQWSLIHLKLPFLPPPSSSPPPPPTLKYREFHDVYCRGLAMRSKFCYVGQLVSKFGCVGSNSCFMGLLVSRFEVSLRNNSTFRTKKENQISL